MATLYSKQQAHVAVGDGTTRFLRLGEPVSDDDPVTKAYPSMFTDDPTPFQVPIQQPPVSRDAMETASADPGEKRAAPKRP
jgi:hypothetical protein